MKIEDAWGMPPHMQALKLNRRPLSQDSILHEFGIQRDDTVRVSFRLRGGAGTDAGVQKKTDGSLAVVVFGCRVKPDKGKGKGKGDKARGHTLFLPQGVIEEEFRRRAAACGGVAESHPQTAQKNGDEYIKVCFDTLETRIYCYSMGDLLFNGHRLRVRDWTPQQDFTSASSSDASSITEVTASKLRAGFDDVEEALSTLVLRIGLLRRACDAEQIAMPEVDVSESLAKLADALAPPGLEPMLWRSRRPQ